MSVGRHQSLDSRQPGWTQRQVYLDWRSQNPPLHAQLQWLELAAHNSLAAGTGPAGPTNQNAFYRFAEERTRIRRL